MEGDEEGDEAEITENMTGKMPEKIIEDFETMLTGGHPNSLGRTVEVVQIILDAPERMGELLDTYDSPNDVVRLRISNAVKRIERANQPLILAHLDTFFDRVIELPTLGAQASAQWTIAQICLAVTPRLTAQQYQRAKTHMMANLDTMNDWIVPGPNHDNTDRMGQNRCGLKKMAAPQGGNRTHDIRPSVAKRAKKCLNAP